MKAWFRKAAHREHFLVQLHVITRTGDWAAGTHVDRVAYSYEPIRVGSLAEARSVAHRLRQDNRWGGVEVRPDVTIHNDRGDWFPESRNCAVPDGRGGYTAWQGR